MKNFLNRLPGPAPVRVLLFVVMVVVALVALLVAFEYLGRYFDQGGTLG